MQIPDAAKAYFSALGRKAGVAKSLAKTTAARENGRKGKGVPKRYTLAERAKRAQRMREYNAKRWGSVKDPTKIS